MWSWARFAGICLAGPLIAGALTACAVIDPVDHRYDTISRSLATARNEAILLNLARASHDYPLSFVTIANVSPSMTNTSTFSLPTFLLGGSRAIDIPARARHPVQQHDRLEHDGGEH